METENGATAHTERLRRLAAEVTAPFVTGGATAVMLAGSAADGTSDEFSDIDLVVFHPQLPGDDEVGAVMAGLGATDHRPLGRDRDAGYLVEQWTIEGVACQYVHQTEACWRAMSAAVLHDHDTDTPTQKALWGFHRGLVLHGQELIERLRAEAVYPEGLARAMVEANLDVFPLWRLADGLARRDAEWWQRSELVQATGKLLALLSGANRVYFSRFQFKHMRSWIDAFDDAPPGVAERIETILRSPLPEAAFMLELLVDETLDVVERRVPDADTSALRGLLHGRQQPWAL